MINIRITFEVFIYCTWLVNFYQVITQTHYTHTQYICIRIHTHICTDTDTCIDTDRHTHTHTHTHTQKKKACSCHLHGHAYMPVHQAGTVSRCRANPPGDGTSAPQEASAHASRMKMWAPEVPPAPSTIVKHAQLGQLFPRSPLIGYPYHF